MMESYENCKELWADLSATGIVLKEERVKHALESHKNQLLNGVLCFKKSKSGTGKKSSTSSLGKSKNVKALVDLISDTICVDQDVAHKMLEQYLMYQFRGEGRTIERYLTDTVLKTGLLADIWTCILREGVYLLHCLKLVLSRPQNHPYYTILDDFVKTLDATVVVEKLMEQMVSLKEESTPSISSLDDEWTASVLARRVILCHAFLFLERPVPVKTVLALINLFRERKFTEQMSSERHKNLVSILKCSQTSLIVHLILQLPKIENSELVREKSAINQLKDLIFGMDSKSGGLMKLAYNASFYTGAEEEAMALVMSAFEENQFEAIHTILMTINDSGDTEVISKTTKIFFELLDIMVERYYVTGFSTFPMFFRACGLVLSHPDTAGAFWEQQECSLRALLKLSLDYFPHLSPPIMHLLRASAKAEKLDQMLQIISEMDMFTEEKSLINLSVQLGQDNDISLMEDMSVMDKLLVIPAGTQGVVSHQNSSHPLVHWNIRFNFWDALYNQLVKINSELRRSQNCDLEKAVLILKCIHTVLKEGHLDDNNMTNVIHESFLLIEIACHMSVPPAEVLAEGLQILRALLNTHRSRVCEMAAQTRLVPCWLGPGPPSLQGQVEYGVWQHLLLGMHIAPAMSALLRAYLRFLIQLTKEETKESSCVSVLAAGMLVVSQNIFPGHSEWLYPRPRDEETIGVLCLQFLQALLNKGDGWEKLIVECLLKTKASTSLMQLAASGEDHIENIMVREPSFLASRTTRLLLKIRLSLSLLNQVLRRRHIVLGVGSRDCILLQQLSSSHQVETDNFYFRLSLYLQSRLHPYLPTLAVKVLQQVFEVLPVSLRFYLRMEDRLIRNTLEMHLLAHDSYPPLRAALLDLLTNCVKTQTQSALLVLMFTQQSKEKEVQALPAEGAKSDTLDFVLSTLNEAAEDPDLVHCPVYKAAVDFCQACWGAPVLYILKSVVNSKDFWKIFTTPLINHGITNDEQNLQLLRVIYIELVRPKFPPEELDKILKTFAQDRLLKWNKFVVEQLKENVDKETPDVDALARVWSNFLVALLKKRRTLLDEHCISELIDEYLDLMQLSMAESGKSSHTSLTAQVLLHLLTTSLSCKDLGEKFVEKVVKVAELSSRRYSYLTTATRTTLLSILAKSLSSDAFNAQQANRLGFDSYVGEMLCKESLEGRRLGLHKGGETMTYVLALRLLQLAGDKLFNFGSELMFSCLTKDAIAMIKEKKSPLCPEIILKILAAVASNPVLAPLLGLQNLKLIWMALLDLKLDMAGSKESKAWDKVYEQGVHLASALVKTNQQLFQTELATFLVEHRAHLISMMIALRAMQDRKTLLIASETIYLLAALSGQLWRNQSALQDYTTGVIACLDLSMIFILRPKLVLDKFANAPSEPPEPFQYVNEKSNLLMSLTDGCLQCLLSVCQPSGQLSRRTLFSDWRQSRLVILDSFSLHHCYDHQLSPSIAFGNLLLFAFNCPLFIHHRETYSRSMWLSEPEIALADEALTLQALKRCIDLLLQQARVQVLLNPDCANFRNSFKTEMDALFEAIKVKIFHKHEDRHMHLERKLKEVEFSLSSMTDKSTLPERTLLTPISTDSPRVVAR
ncbi:uncharacterized protein LOC132195387 [Neocloeon triangulifer]|uniref:uncharacterized protein LOC132195387 n=1 Tax=Neocloeon triangulifer TaxID=2078957 RepID=UPI00286EC7AE|nr:uncharacterized protein LOC132195387 [Neocloeon triangulifer]